MHFYENNKKNFKNELLKTVKGTPSIQIAPIPIHLLKAKRKEAIQLKLASKQFLC